MAINGKFKVNHGDVFPHGRMVAGADHRHPR